MLVSALLANTNITDNKLTNPITPLSENWLSVDGIDNGQILFDPATGTIIDSTLDITNATIPEMINGIAVKAISEFAFFDCINLTSLSIPEGVISIGDSAFQNCTELTTVILPFSVLTIGNYAFYNCTKLSQIIAPMCLATSGHNAFSYCPILTPVMSSPHVFTYPNQPASYESVNLSSYTNNFAAWAKLGETISAKPELKTPDLSSAKWVALQSGGQVLFDIKAGAILDASTKITAAVIPANLAGVPVRSIADYAFYNCPKLIYASIPAGVTAIGHNAFSYCDKLKGVAIPSTITTLKTDAPHSPFYKTKLTVYYEGTANEWQALEADPTLTVKYQAAISKLDEVALTCANKIKAANNSATDSTAAKTNKSLPMIGDSIAKANKSASDAPKPKLINRLPMMLQPKLINRLPMMLQPKLINRLPMLPVKANNSLPMMLQPKLINRLPMRLHQS